MWRHGLALALLLAGAGCFDWESLSPDVDASLTVQRCPSALPAAWIFCDDFEAPGIEDRYVRVDDAGGTFVRSTARAASGAYAMEIAQPPNVSNTGTMSVVFGTNPVGASLRAEEKFLILHVRFRVLHERADAADSWKRTRHRFAKLGVVVTEAGGWSTFTHLWQPYIDQYNGLFGADVATCVEDDEVVCPTWDSYPPANTDEFWIGNTVIASDILDPSDAERWRCIEARIVLGINGASSGQVTISVDGVQETQRSGFAMNRNSEYGLDAFVIDTGQLGPEVSAEGAVLHRWIDDLVISTAPIGCD